MVKSWLNPIMWVKQCDLHCPPVITIFTEFYRWYLFHSQIRVVYGIVFPTLVTMNTGIIPPFIVYVPIFSHIFPYFAIFSHLFLGYGWFMWNVNNPLLRRPPPAKPRGPAPQRTATRSARRPGCPAGCGASPANVAARSGCLATYWACLIYIVHVLLCNNFWILYIYICEQCVYIYIYTCIYIYIHIHV